MTWKLRDETARKKIAEAVEETDNPADALRALVRRVGHTPADYEASASVFNMEIVLVEFFRRTYPFWGTLEEMSELLQTDKVTTYRILERVSQDSLLLEFREPGGLNTSLEYRWRKHK